MTLVGDQAVDAVTSICDLQPVTITPNVLAQALFGRDYQDGDFTFVTAPTPVPGTTGDVAAPVAASIVDQADAFIAAAASFTCTQADELVVAYQGCVAADVATAFIDAHVLGDNDGVIGHDDADHLALKASLGH